MKIIIREYDSLDFEGLSVLLFDNYKATIDKETLEREYLGDDKSIMIAYDEENNKVVGCAFIEIQKDYIRPRKIIYVTYVAVDKNLRGNGIGRLIMNCAEEVCRKEDCQAIEFTSADYRTEAHAFYEYLGYTKKKTTLFIKEI